MSTEDKTYAPRDGTIAAAAVAHLQRMAPAPVSSQALAEAVGSNNATIGTLLAVPLKHGLVARSRARDANGHSITVWSLGLGTPASDDGRDTLDVTTPADPTDDDDPAADAPPFVCALWCDGDLTLRVNGEDVWIAKADADALRRYLAQFPTPTPEPEAQPS